MTRLAVFAMILVMSSVSVATAALPDVTVTWDAGFPNKENGKLKMQGKVVFNNGWSSTGDKALITIKPSAGGALIPVTTKLKPDGSWSAELDLTVVVNKQSYDITSSVQAKKGKDAKAVTGERKTMELP